MKLVATTESLITVFSTYIAIWMTLFWESWNLIYWETQRKVWWQHSHWLLQPVCI